MDCGLDINPRQLGLESIGSNGLGFGLGYVGLGLWIGSNPRQSRPCVTCNCRGLQLDCLWNALKRLCDFARFASVSFYSLAVELCSLSSHELTIIPFIGR